MVIVVKCPRLVEDGLWWGRRQAHDAGCNGVEGMGIDWMPYDELPKKA